MLNDLTAPSKLELSELVRWVSDERAAIPEKKRRSLQKLIAVYSRLVDRSAPGANQILIQLRQAMGILPKSERGGVNPGAAPAAHEEPVELSPVEAAQYEELLKKRCEARRQEREYDRKVRDFRAHKRRPAAQMEFDLGKPSEMLFSFPMAIREKREEEPRSVARLEEFGKSAGLHVAYDYPKRMDLSVVATEITYKVETVTDPATGKSVRASMKADGPERFQMTWGAVGNLIKMHVGFAIPINRMKLMIGQSEFSTSKICRVLQHVAMNCVGIYLCLADELADVKFVSGDDTPAKVLDTSDPEDPDMISTVIDALLGWTQPRADGRGDKTALNVSLIVGKTATDPRSTIRFFRTHAGSVGNLLTKILEGRRPGVGPVIFQGDLSTTNLPSPEIRSKVGFVVAGCGAHARRPFWRFRDKDKSLCYFLLKGFLLLSAIEARIDERGRTRENVLRYRNRYGRRIWLAMRSRCIAAVTGEVSSPGIYPSGITPSVWPPNTDLHRAAQYVINHFEELTLYLEHPELEYTNNGRERALRIEKCMLSSSKFRKTKRGRVTLDILRTINATCTAANVEITDYLKFIFFHVDELPDHPEDFTPFAFAKLRDQNHAASTAT
jgi:hypothetical protein